MSDDATDAEDASADEGHGPIACYVDALRHLLVLECACGERCEGDTWEEAGAEMDAHLDGEDPE